MAAKNLEEALYNANIDIEIKKALCIGPLSELVHRIEIAEQIIIENLKNELRDYFAHQTMYADGDAKKLFERVFKDISASKGDIQ